jgi:hypothetical protein
MARYLYLSGYGRDIGNSTRAIETARDTARRAAAYAQRGGAYSEKARYCRAFKLIPADEYDRLFSLAIKEHDQAVALDPASAQAYFSRGRTYYDRAALEVDKDATRWFGPAAADFQKAVERDGRQYMAWEMLGLVHEQTGELDKAIGDYTQEMALNPLGKASLADAYCERGSFNHKEKKYDAADGSSCDPYDPLIALYPRQRGPAIRQELGHRPQGAEIQEMDHARIAGEIEEGFRTQQLVAAADFCLRPVKQWIKVGFFLIYSFLRAPQTAPPTSNYAGRLRPFRLAGLSHPGAPHAGRHSRLRRKHPRTSCLAADSR